MSKLIKSINANQPKSNGKTIELRSIPTFSENKEVRTAHGSQEGKNNDGNDVQYIEQQELLDHEKAEIEQLKLELQVEKEQWSTQIEEQQKQIEEEANLRFNQAAEEGFDQGYRDGLEQGKEQYSLLNEQARQTIETSQLDYFNKLAESEPIMLEIALMVAEKIVNQTMDQDDQAWMNIVKNAVTEIREHEEVKIYVHPSWYEVTIKQKQELKDIALHTRELLIFPDEHLEENGCILETPFGQIDATVDSQLREVKKVLFEKLKEGVTDGHS